MIRRILRRIKLWLAIQSLPVLAPHVHRELTRRGEGHIREASEVTRRRCKGPPN